MQIKPPSFPKRRILYYPTIDIPSSSWLRQAILYWDEISSIVPQTYDGNLLSRLSEDVQYLMSEGEFKPISPEDLVFNQKNSNAFNQFKQEFIGMTSGPEYQKFLNQRYYQLTRKAFDKPYYSKIHSNKTTHGLYNHLEELNLIKESDENGWFEMETNTALLYMSLLAKYLAKLQEEHTSIGTNYAVYEKMNFKRVNSSIGYPVISLNLNHVLPIPQENVPLDKILDFKRKRKTNLMRFRKLLLTYQKEISRAGSNEELRELTTNFSEELILGINDLKAVMKDSKINSRIKSVRSLINFQSAPTLVAAGALAGTAIDILPSSIAVPVAIVSGGIELGLNFIENRIEQSGNERDSAFSYVYQAQQAGILKSFTNK